MPGYLGTEGGGGGAQIGDKKTKVISYNSTWRNVQDPLYCNQRMAVYGLKRFTVPYINGVMSPKILGNYFVQINIGVEKNFATGA
jgi:hypothetical protein